MVNGGGVEAQALRVIQIVSKASTKQINALKYVLEWCAMVINRFTSKNYFVPPNISRNLRRYDTLSNDGWLNGIAESRINLEPPTLPSPKNHPRSRASRAEFGESAARRNVLRNPREPSGWTGRNEIVANSTNDDRVGTESSFRGGFSNIFSGLAESAINSDVAGERFPENVME